MIYKIFSKFIPLCIALFATFIPFSMIIGSKMAWFSCSSMAFPALGYHASLLYVILSLFTKGLLSFHAIIFFAMHRLPHLAATSALRKKNWIISVVLPAGAMILFCMHTIGQTVYYYSWYWFIPMIIYYLIPDTLPSRAVCASFVAHAVGSVIWLYHGHVPVQAWTLLMPIVPLERIIIAAGMLSFVYIFQAISNLQTDKVAA